MIINGMALLKAAPIKAMMTDKAVANGGTSFGLGEAGYDIRIAQDVFFRRLLWFIPQVKVGRTGKWKFGRFALASSMEAFDMPSDVVGVVHDKSTWARRTLSVFNTVIEPGWKGFLTLELVYNGTGSMHIPAGSGIAQVVFQRAEEMRPYNGKYQNQPNMPVGPINSENPSPAPF